MTDEILAAIAERMNRLDAVVWDRCVILDAEATAFGWVARPDGRSDFVSLQFSWGVTTGLDGDDLAWLSVGFTTSSAGLSGSIAETLYGTRSNHTDCERVENVFGCLVKRKVELA